MLRMTYFSVMLYLNVFEFWCHFSWNTVYFKLCLLFDGWKA